MQCLVVGGGPSGLAAALFLSERGITARVIDKKDGPSRFSKALGVSPRTLELLEPSGLTERFLRNGRKMERINVWHNQRIIFKNQLGRVKHRYPFMLIQPQQESEKLLSEELNRRGIPVEWGVELKEVHSEFSPVRTELQHANGRLKEVVSDFVIGADRARSHVREQLKVVSEGFRYEEVWELYDVALDSPLASNDGHIFLFNYLKKTVQRINAMTQIMTGHTALSRYIRKNTSWLRIFFPILAPTARRFVMGLDK